MASCDEKGYNFTSDEPFQSRSAKATKMTAESMEEQYVWIELQIEFMFTAWCVKEVAEL